MGKAMEIFLERATTAWNKWEIKAMILSSLLLQTYLTITGHIRKYSSSKKLNIGVWIAYQLSNSLLLYSLSVLQNNVFWIPFFVLHLGGPDTITAYALEDNELLGRYTGAFVSYLILAFFAYFQASTKTVPYFVVFPMIIAGGVKTAGRILAMWHASSKQFNLRSADPGPNYARYMEEYSLKKDEGFEVKVERFKETPILGDLPVPENELIPDADTLQAADTFFQNFKLLFAGIDHSKEFKLKSKSFFQRASFEDAFKVIEVELGFMYDFFYTKAFMIFSRWGGLLHFSSFISTLSALWVFMSFKKSSLFSKAEVCITYVLVGGAIFLEIYAAWVLLTSDWTMLWLSRRKNAWVDLLYRAISSIPSVRNKRWSNTMAQYSLIKYCLRNKPAMYGGIQKFSCINKLLEKHLWTIHVSRYQDNLAEVSIELKKLILDQLLEKSRSIKEAKDCEELCAYRGDRVLKFAECLDEISEEDRKTLKESVEVEFDQSILMWHIATTLTYNNDRNSDPNTTQNYVNWTNCEASKLLSNYMLYLLVICPSMLPDGIEKIRFQDTCAEAIEFFEEKTSVSDVYQACTKLLEVTTDISPVEVKGETSKSVLFDGCRLAQSLQGLDIEKRWELICNVWVEMLCNAACKCRWNNHAKGLTRGGELLTHVWLLMAHLSITDQF